MAVDARRDAVADELRRFLDDEAAGFPAMAQVFRALSARGRSLAGDGGFYWGSIPLLVCEAAGGDPERALSVAVAFECVVSALDVLDDVEDRDNPDALWRSAGVPTAVNVATLLLFLGQLAIGRLARHGVPDGLVAEAGRVFATAGARACQGQQVDLDQMDGREVDEATYLSTVGAKSGALVAGGCRAGAILATAGRPRIDGYSRFGLNVGVAMQIQNDLTGVSSESLNRNDLRDGKRTLPLIFALECAPATVRTELARVFAPGRPAELSIEDVARARALLAESGGLLYAMTVADVYWERALAWVEDLAGPETGCLRRLIDRLRSG
ncbi:MAG: polyprenyl synthetase family protein [Chloroflexota bacterium]